MALFHNYIKEGKGVSKYAPQKKRPFLFFDILKRKIGKLITVNLLFVAVTAVISLIPVLIGLFLLKDSYDLIKMFMVFAVGSALCGPAMAGMTYIIKNLITENPVFMVSDFMDNVKENWKQAIAVSLLQSIITVICVVSLLFYWNQVPESSVMLIPFIVTLVFTVVLLFASFYPYLLMVTVELKFIDIIKNSFIFAVVGMKTNAITLIITGIMTFLAYWYFPVSCAVLLVIGFSLIAFVTCFNSYQYVYKYCVKPYFEQNDLEEEELDEDEVVFQDTVGLENKNNNTEDSDK